MSEKIKHTKGSDNVFADLKVKNADEHDLKSTLGIMIIKLMREKNIKQTSAATLFGITQPEVSRLKGGNLSHYSVERLLGFLTKLNQRIEIKISPSNWRKAAEIVLV
jgi:predicted XRE-type DNA-binding protein